MANVWAIKTGNWNDPTVWNTGSLPTAADDVYANNFTVNVNQNIAVASLRNSAITGVTLGGYFTFNTSGVTADISNNVYATKQQDVFIKVTATSGNVVINIPSAIVRADVFNVFVFQHTGACNLTITATALNCINGDGLIIQKTSLGNLIINANVESNGGAVFTLANNSTTIINGNITGSGSIYAVSISGGLVTINGNITGSSGSAAPLNINGGTTNITGTVKGIVSSGITVSGGFLNITGTIQGSNSNGIGGVIVSGSGNLNHIGSAQASSFSSAIVCNSPTTSTVICTGPFLKNGYIVAIASQTFRINFGANSYFQFKKSSGEDIDYVSTVEGYNYPTASDVRDGIVYKSGLVTGTLKVPNPADVRKSIPTDNTVGTADITPEDFINALQVSTADIAKRLRNCATVESTGAQLEAYD